MHTHTCKMHRCMHVCINKYVHASIVCWNENTKWKLVGFCFLVACMRCCYFIWQVETGPQGKHTCGGGDTYIGSRKPSRRLRMSWMTILCRWLSQTCRIRDSWLVQISAEGFKFHAFRHCGFPAGLLPNHNKACCIGYCWYTRWRRHHLSESFIVIHNSHFRSMHAGNRCAA
jgi:hypothetical protein